MAKKPKIKPIDLSKESLMKQPTAYTLMPKKATLTQMKVFTVIMYRLQAFFNKVIEEKYKTPEKNQQLFLDFAADNGEFVIAKEATTLIDQGDVLIDIPLRDLHIEPKNYPAAVETLWRVASTPCVINDEETGEQKITNFMYLVKGGNVTTVKKKVTELDPATGKTVTREIETIHYKQPRIRMGIPRAVAGQIFDIDIRGYDQFSLPAALTAGSVYTLLIYILVSGQYHRGNNQFQKDYMELREELGFFDSPDEKNASKYLEWAQFERGVMRVAKDELDRKLRNGEIDMSFDFEPIFDRWLNPATGRTKRIVQRITFRVIPSATIAHLLTVQPTETDELIRRMIGDLKLTPAQVNGKRKGFLTRTKQLLGTDGINRLRAKVDELITEKDKRTDILNIGRWACTSLNQWLLEVASPATPTPYPAQPLDTPIPVPSRPTQPSTPSARQPLSSPAPSGSPARTTPATQPSRPTPDPFRLREGSAGAVTESLQLGGDLEGAALAAARTVLAQPSPLPDSSGVGLTGAEARAIYEAVTALRDTLTPDDYEHWAQPVITQHTPLDGNALIVRYYGPYYHRKRARQYPAFCAVRAAIDTATAGRINDIHAIHCANGKERKL